jgi:hypothetical protein
MTQRMLGFDDIESACIEALCKKKGEYLNQYDIIGYIFEKFGIIDPNLRKELKIRIMIVLNTIYIDYDGIRYIKKDNNIYLSFKESDESSQNINFNIDEKKEEEIGTMPSYINIVDYILDNNLKDYIDNTKDGENTILHLLVLNNDFERIKEHYDKLKELFIIKNDKNETPVNLIKDIRIYSLLANDLNNIVISTKNEVESIKIEIESIKNDLMLTKNRLGELQNYVSSSNILLNSIFWCMFIFFGFYYFTPLKN